ncbi:DNA-directed RNA polymerase subunit omega [Gammaproteobacteria bacterium]|nr:DNA-directed RNA polymerase subunit omega [Gammaproteobacteria bacterium]
MARVTVEDCLKYIPNRFDLILVAAKRAHQLSSGGFKSTLDVGKDKPTIVALREIEEGLIDNSILTEEYEMEEELSAQNQINQQNLMSEVEEELSQVAIDEELDDLVEDSE